MNILTYIVDAFTDEAFKGNPAGICILEENIDEDMMQAIAMELNLSETAFVKKIGESNYSIRYFSPKMEIPFCGHATLGSSKVILDKNNLETVTFHTKNGLQISSIVEDEYITMEFPVYETQEESISLKMLKALGLQKIENARYAVEPKMLLIEISSSKELFDLEPNFNLLVKSNKTINGVIVTANSQNTRYDFYSRYFWPWSGSNEDPVTGAAHSVLSKYWADKLSKIELKAFQASKRGGYLNLKLNEAHTLLKVKSNAVIVLKGTINI